MKAPPPAHCEKQAVTVRRHCASSQGAFNPKRAVLLNIVCPVTHWPVKHLSKALRLKHAGASVIVKDDGLANMAEMLPPLRLR